MERRGEGRREEDRGGEGRKEREGDFGSQSIFMGATHIIPFADAGTLGHMTLGCNKGTLCASEKHQLLIGANGSLDTLLAYPMDRVTVGRHVGKRRQFTFSGFCVGPSGDTLLVLNYYGQYVQECQVTTGVRRRTIGQGVVAFPTVVACNATVIAVGDFRTGHVTMFSYQDGGLLRGLGVSPTWQHRLTNPACVTLLRNGRDIVVPDGERGCLCVFTTTGALRTTVRDDCGNSSLIGVVGVVEHAADGSLMVLTSQHDTVFISADGVIQDTPDAIRDARNLVALSNDEFIVERANGRLDRVRCLALRAFWVVACVTLATSQRRGEEDAKRQKH